MTCFSVLLRSQGNSVMTDFPFSFHIEFLHSAMGSSKLSCDKRWILFGSILPFVHLAPDAGASHVCFSEYNHARGQYYGNRWTQILCLPDIYGIFSCHMNPKISYLYINSIEDNHSRAGVLLPFTWVWSLPRTDCCYRLCMYEPIYYLCFSLMSSRE